MLVRCSAVRFGALEMAHEPGRHWAGLSLAAPTAGSSAVHLLAPLCVQSCPVHGRWPPLGVPALWPGCQDFPPFLSGWSSLSLGVLVFCWVWGAVLLRGGPRVHFNHVGLVSQGAETLVIWGRGCIPGAWDKPGVPPLSLLCPHVLGPPAQCGSVRDLCPFAKNALLSTCSCFPCRPGYCAVTGNSIPAVLGLFRKKRDSARHSWGFLPHRFLWF